LRSVSFRFATALAPARDRRSLRDDKLSLRDRPSGRFASFRNAGLVSRPQIRRFTTDSSFRVRRFAVSLVVSRPQIRRFTTDSSFRDRRLAVSRPAGRTRGFVARRLSRFTPADSSFQDAGAETKGAGSRTRRTGQFEP